MRSVWLFLLLAVNVSAACGQPLTLDEAVRLTLAQSPQVKALLHDIAAAERGYAGARAWMNPSITFTPGLTRAGSDEELLISQPLELNGTRAARSSIAGYRLRAVKAESLIQLSDIVYQAKTAYLMLARSQERWMLARDLVKNAEGLDQTAKRQVELGSRPGVEQTQTSIELSRAQQQATLAEAEYISSLAEFNTVLGRPLESQSVLASLQFDSQTVDELDLLKQASENRGELALALATKQLSIQEARLARAEGLPDLIPHFRASSLIRSPRESGFGIGISIPLLDYGSLRNRERQALESAKAQEFRITATRNQVQKEVKQALARLRAADVVLKSYQAGMLDNARKLIDATRRGFDLGDTTLLAVLEAQRTFRSIQSEYIDALVSHEQARVQLERAVGSIHPSLLKELTTLEANQP